MTAKTGNPNEHTARDNRRPVLLAVVSLALLALSTLLVMAPQAPQPLHLLGRLLAVAVALNWSLTLLRPRLPALLPVRALKAETPRTR